VSADIGPGSLVEVVRDVQFRGHEFMLPKGAVDRVEEIVDIGAPWLCYTCAEIIHEAVRLVRMPKRFAICLCAVKPIRGGEPGMFNHLLKAPTRRCEPA
jgi:hypothetical protein